MAVSMISIGAFEAKTHFSELVRNVQEGVTYTITKNNKPVAILRATENQKSSPRIEAFQRIANRARTMKGFSLSEIQEMRDEGRNY